MTGTATILRQTDTIRLVSSARLKPPVLQPLADTDGELADLARLESATHGRLRAEEGGLAGLEARELAFNVPNYTFINAAFVYTRPGGNRFNDDTRGAWYCGFEVATSLDEVAFHLSRALADAGGAFVNETVYAELYADFNGPFHDLRGLSRRPKCLHPEIDIGYPAGQALAADLRKAGRVLGVVYPSVRHAGGTCLAAFHPYVVQNVRQGALWRLTWTGSPQPAIRQVTEPRG